MDKQVTKATKELLSALERAKVHHEELRRKREEKLWKKVTPPVQLIDMLNLHTKDDLGDIRQRLNLNGMSSLRKAELASELAGSILFRFEKILSILDEERYALIKKIIKNSGSIPVQEDFPISKVKTMMELGIVFPVLHDGQKQLSIPSDLVEQFAAVDTAGLQEKISENTEWIRLTHGMLYFYGIMETSKALDKISALTKREVDIFRYSEVVHAASDYYEQMRVSLYSYGGYLVHEDVIDERKVIEDHKARPNVDFYPFTKKQLLEAGDPSYIDKSPEMVKFLRFLSNSYELTAEDKDEIADTIVYLNNTEGKPSKVMEFLESILEYPTFEFVQELTEHVMNVHNHTRLWMLKGHSPVGLREKEEKRSKPAFPLNQTQNVSNVIDLNSRKRAGRNDPCPCGSGKKYKKCCGK